jgi:hypothetical protein
MSAAPVSAAAPGGTSDHPDFTQESVHASER